MVTSTDTYVIPAAAAADLALITYRQLDHWARKGWITPSIQSASGRGGRRLYSMDDVLRLSALRHFARSGWQVNELGNQIADCDIVRACWLVAGTESGLIAIESEDELHELLGLEERFSVYDLRPLRDRIVNRQGLDSYKGTMSLRRPA